MKKRVFIFAVLLSASMTLIASDFTFTLTVLDYDEEPVVSYRVELIQLEHELGTRTKITNIKGEAVFHFTLPGKHRIKIFYGDRILHSEIYLLSEAKNKLTITVDSTLVLESWEMETAQYEEAEAVSDTDEYADSKKQFEKSEKAQKLFNKNHFVVMPSDEKEPYKTYERAGEEDDSVFVTTDVVLHTAHLLFDYTLRYIELKYLYPVLEDLSDKMMDASKAQYQSLENKELKEKARLNYAFFAVVKKILDPYFMPELETQGLVNAELRLIRSASQQQPHPLLNYIGDKNYTMEDYTQYVPRGHYTRRNKLKAYFKAMMFLGRMDFELKPGNSSEDINNGRKMTQQALLMTDAIFHEKNTIKLYKKLDSIIQFYIGSTDDPGIREYHKVMIDVYGENYEIRNFSNHGKLDTFISKMLKTRKPAIISNTFTGPADRTAQSQHGFRFMGQRYTMDAYFFQALTGLQYEGKLSDNKKPFTYVSGERGFPRGLDIMAILGSQRAIEILNQSGDTNYKNYHAIIHKLKAAVQNFTQSEWNQSLYTKWLHALVPLLKTPVSDYAQKFILTSAWQDKSLFTSLASWTELKHDTVLYAKQPYQTPIGTVASHIDELEFPCGYVEPYPETYARIKEMIIKLSNMLDDLGVKEEEITGNYKSFTEILEKLEYFAKGELEGKTFTKSEYSDLQYLVGVLEDIKGFSPEIMRKITDGSDDKMDVIADVFTNPQAGQVLEEGVGKPLNIFVYIDDKMGKRICRGVVFSYYEFKWPMTDRLTDKKWQQMGKLNKRPEMPVWTKSFYVEE